VADEQGKRDEIETSGADSGRRALLRRAGLAGAGAALIGSLAASGEAGTGKARASPPEGRQGTGEIPRRAFGKTGAQVSLLRLGSHRLGEAKIESEAVRTVHEAVDAGVTFMDNTWEYYDGRSEE